MPLPPYDDVRRVVDEVGPSGAYRLLLALLASQRGRDLPAALGHPSLPDPEPLLARLRAASPSGEPDPTAELVALGDLHQRLLAADERRAAGAWFTPWALADHLVAQVVHDGARVLDPTCGGGVFLAAAARRLVTGPDPVATVTELVHGIDLDPHAVELSRVVLWLELLPWLDPGAPLPELALRVGDALADASPGPSSYDVVVGNPPFLNQLERATAQERSAAERLRREEPGVLGPYTDLSAVFLLRAASWVRPGGRVALVQPVSLLSARDAGGVRARLAETCVLEGLWRSDGPAFGASVTTCVPVLHRGAGEQGDVARTRGLPPAPAPSVPAGDLSGSWGHLVSADLGVPAVRWRTEGVVGDLAECTADFRDQYYGLAGAVEDGTEGPGRVPLVTSGLVEPARCDWGVRPTRFLKQRWTSPVVVLERLDERLAGWARARLVPKVLVGTQGRVVEAVADPDGRWLPSVPVISVVPHDDRLWHVLAVLLAPPVSAHAASTYAGAALSAQAIKLSARQVASLPLPVLHQPWDEAAHLLSERQEAALEEAARLMCTAYDVQGDEVLTWWLERALRRTV